MRPRRAIRASLAFYLVFALVAALVSVVLGINVATVSLLPVSYWFTLLLSGVVLSALFSWLYFRGKVRASVRQGLYLGLYFVGTGAVLDALFIVMSRSDAWMTFLHSFMWLTMLFIVLTSTVIGWKMKQ